MKRGERARARAKSKKKKKKGGRRSRPLSAKKHHLLYKAPRARYPNTRRTTLMMNSPASVAIPVAVFPLVSAWWRAQKSGQGVPWLEKRYTASMSAGTLRKRAGQRRSTRELSQATTAAAREREREREHVTSGQRHQR